MPRILGLTLLGAIIGTVTGLLPGLHPNTLIFSSLPLLIRLPPQTALPLIVTAAVSHSMLNHIPAILIGIPDEGSALTALPGKEMLLNGQGGTAIHATLTGGLHTTATALPLIPLTFIILPPIYQQLRPILIFGISLVIGLMVVADERPGTALVITLLCGLVGTLTLAAPMSGADALFPLFIGLFGLPVLLATTDGTVPDQDIVSQRSVYPRSSIVGTAAGLLSGFLPGLGPSATVALFDRFLDREHFITALGGINTADALFSLIALHTIGNPRSGASIAVQKLIAPDNGTFLLVTGCSLIGIAVSYHLGQLLLPQLLHRYPQLDHRKIARTTAASLILLTFIITGIGGLAILAAGTGAGLLTQQLRVRKSLCMSCLILPFLLQEFGVTL